MTTSPKKITKIDSSLRSESLSGISNSERLVKNLYGSPPIGPVILYRRYRTCTPMQSLFDLIKNSLLILRFAMTICLRKKNKNRFFAFGAGWEDRPRLINKKEVI